MNELKQFIIVYILLSILPPVLLYVAIWIAFYGFVLVEDDVFWGIQVFLLGCVLGIIALFKVKCLCLLVLYLKKYRHSTNQYIYKIFNSIKLLAIMLPLTYGVDVLINTILQIIMYEGIYFYKIGEISQYTIFLSYTFDLYCLIAIIVLINNFKRWIKKVK